jgi:hypothetical protein
LVLPGIFARIFGFFTYVFAHFFNSSASGGPNFPPKSKIPQRRTSGGFHTQKQKTNSNHNPIPELFTLQFLCKKRLKKWSKGARLLYKNGQKLYKSAHNWALFGHFSMVQQYPESVFAPINTDFPQKNSTKFPFFVFSIHDTPLLFYAPPPQKKT